MNRNLIVGMLMSLSIPIVTLAEEAPADRPAVNAALPEIRIEAAKTEVGAKGCDIPILKSAEDLNDKMKPVREIAGYLHSPQGLVLKVVNDHVMRIPAWVGYALDPAGSIKHRALDEIKDLAKSALRDEHACPAVEPSEATGAAGSTKPVDSI